MSYFVVCTFDLEKASSEDYDNAYSDLEEMGLSHSITSNKGKLIELPSTTTAGEFDGESSSKVRDIVLEKISKAFKARSYTSEIFIATAGNWTWIHSST